MINYAFSIFGDKRQLEIFKVSDKSLLGKMGSYPNSMIRKALESEAKVIHDIHTRAVKEACKGFYTDEQITGWLKNRSPEGYAEGIKNDEMYVDEIEGKIIGFGHAVPGEILAIFVDPTFHKKGIGRSLLQHGLEMAKKGNPSAIKAEASLNAVPFYKKHGFIEIGERIIARNGQKLPIVLMEYSPS